ncbi:MAG: hypothetical protein WCS52_13110 [bacterium]
MNPTPSSAASDLPAPVSLLPASRFPPHLSMDQYVDFVEESLRAANVDQVVRQKALEERIRKPFCISAA